MNAFAFDNILPYTCPDSVNFNTKQDNKINSCFHVCNSTEPTSVLDSRRSPLSSTTMSSSLGCNSSGTAAGPGGGGGGGGGGCFGGVDELESVFSECPSQQQSILKLIMGDVVDDQSLVLQSFGTDFNRGFSNQSFNFEHSGGGGENLVSSNIQSCSDFPFSVVAQNLENASDINNPSKFDFVHNVSPLLSSSSSLFPGGLNQQRVNSVMDEKSHSLVSRGSVYPNQVEFSQNQSLFLPFLNAQMQEHIVPPPHKRLNSGGVGMACQVPKPDFSGCEGIGQAMFLRQHQLQQQPSQFLPHHLQQRSTAIGGSPKQKIMISAGDAVGNDQLLFDQLFKVAEYIETGNSVLAQEILARLNHQILPVGKAFNRAAYYFKEALQTLVLMNKKTPSPLSNFDVIFKIAAYKSFSEVSPVIQFANLTCNQAILETIEGFDKIHVIDFDIGYGGQWSSLMQELALRKGGVPTLKITAFSSPSSHDYIELGFTREGLIDFAQQLNIPFELEIVNLESLNAAASWPLSINVLAGEAIAVNLPVAYFSKSPLPLPVLLRFVKQLSPKIVVSLEQGCERTAFRFPDTITHALQSYSTLLESLDGVNVNPDALQKIERFLIQPSIENLVLGHQRYHEITHPWRSVFLSSGFSPTKFSNFAESQAECLLQRTPAQGFHFQKRQSSLVLSWQRKELISASAWKC